MNLEPRTVELSRDNFNSAIESLLRATDVIHDSETPCDLITILNGHAPVKIIIHFKQEVQKPVDQTVH